MKPKFFLLTTVSMSLNFFEEQVKKLSEFYEMTLISSPSDQLREVAERENAKYKGVIMKREISLISDIISLFRLMVFFYSQKPQIIHCNTPKVSLLGLLAGKLSFVPRRIYYIHGLRYEGSVGMKKKLLMIMEKISCMCATDIIAVSKGVKYIVENELTDKKIKLIHKGSANGMKIQDFDLSTYNTQSIKEELNIKPSDFVFGFVGRIVGDKGINELVKAFDNLNRHYDTIKLVLVGFYEDHLDPLTIETKTIIQNNPNIIETGFQKDVKKYLSIMDIFVSPSYREGFGLSLLEANAMGKPVIATRITGYSEIIEENINGFLVPSKNREALEEKMLWVLNNNELLKEMSSGCRKIVVEKYDHADVVEHALLYYKSLL